MLDSVFKEYDIRGKVNGELTIAETYQLGCAIAYYFKEQKPFARKVMIGMDTRSSSPTIKENVTKAFIDSGFDVIFIGICPSPVLYFGHFSHEVDGALIITASHNPPEYNGIKLIFDKKFIWGKQIKYIGQLFRQGKKVESAYQGKETHLSLNDEYTQWMVTHFPELKNSNLAFGIDVGNASAALIIPALVKAFSWQKVKVFCDNIQAKPIHEADPIVEKNMICIKDAIEKKEIDFGIGLDGDADRMDAMTQSGYLIPGDRLLAIFAQEVVKSHPGTSVVFDIKSSSGLFELLKKWGAKAVISPSGHALIKEHMYEHQALLGGELSCHFFFQDHYFGFDDGIYAMLRLLSIMVKSGKTLDELVGIFPPRISSPEYRIPVEDSKKAIIIDTLKENLMRDKDAEIITIDGVRASFPFGWGIVRASNTQAVLSIRFESDTQIGLHKIKERFIKAFGNTYDQKILKKELELGK